MQPWWIWFWRHCRWCAMLHVVCLFSGVDYPYNETTLLSTESDCLTSGFLDDAFFVAVRVYGGDGKIY